MPAGVELATAYITLAAETSGLARDLQRDLTRAGNTAGTRAGSDFADSFTGRTRGIGNDVERQVGRADAGNAGRRAGSDFADRFTGEVDGVGDSVNEALNGAGRGAGDAGGGMGGDFLGGFSDKIKGLAGKGGPIAGALAGVAVVGLAAGKVLADAVSDGMQQMQQRDLIQARLGVNEETMNVIGTASGAAFGNAWGESVQANMEAAQLAIQSGIMTGEENASDMQTVLTGLNTVTDLMGGEMPDTIRAVSALMKNDLVSGSQDAFDVITKGFQRSGDLGDDLIDTVSEYSNGWKQTGFSAEFAMALVNQSVKNGADNTDRAGDAIREFGRRLVEEGDTIKGAIGDLGLPVDELFGKLKAGGPEGEAAFDQIFDSIRQIEDPLKRASVAQSLLGDTAGDFINSFTQWDPSTAVKAFGDVAGAADKAGATMSSNPGAQWQSSMNQITLAADQVKLSLGQAFGPSMSELATWVSAHQPEIIGFFTGLADAALGTLDAVLGFSSGALKAWAFFAEGVGGTIGTVVQQMATLVDAQASVLDLIPGMGGQADDFRGIADGMRGFAESVGTAGDKARGMADIIDNTLRPGIQGMRTDVQDAGAKAQDSALLMRALGTEVQLVPNEKEIQISENTPAVRSNLEALGLKVVELPDGEFVIRSNTNEGQAVLDNFVRNNSGREIDLTIRYNEIRTQRMQENPGFVGPIGGFAKGGPVRGPGSGTSDSILAMLSNGEFVTPADAVNSETLPILEAIRGGWVPPAGMLHDMLPGFAGGGVVSADELVQFAQGVEGAAYEWGGVNWGDCSGAVSAIANYATGASPFATRFATGNEGDSLAAMGFQPGIGPAGSLSIGWYNGGEYGGHTAATLPNGVNFEMGGQRGDGQYGGIAAGADDPMFTDQMHLPPEAFLGGDPGVIGGPGATQQGLVGGGSGGGGAAGGGGLGGSGGGGGGTGGGGSSSGAVSVFVTNWPNGATTTEQIAGGSTPAPSAPTAATAAAPPVDPTQERLNQLGADMGQIGLDSALETLGIDGTLLDPNHRYWQAARDITDTAAKTRAEAIPAPTEAPVQDFSIHIGQVSNPDPNQVVRQLTDMQNRQAMRYAGRPV